MRQHLLGNHCAVKGLRRSVPVHASIGVDVRGQSLAPIVSQSSGGVRQPGSTGGVFVKHLKSLNVGDSDGVSRDGVLYRLGVIGRGHAAMFGSPG